MLSNLYQNSCKDKRSLPMDVRAAILPLYNDLYKRENLSKCLHWCTQTSNQSFNGMIWSRVPKANHGIIDILSLSVYDAIAHFNDGTIASLENLNHMNVELRDHMMRDFQIQTESRKIHAAYRMSEPKFKRRKTIRHCRNKKQDKNLNKEATTYEVGEFENELIYILLRIYFALNTCFL